MQTTGPPWWVKLSDLLGPLPPAMQDYPDHGELTWRGEDMRAYAAQEVAAERERCQPNGLMFDAMGEPRNRYVRVTLNGSHCVMHPSDGDRYLQDARDAGDDSNYTVANVYLSEREFDDLPEHDGF